MSLTAGYSDELELVWLLNDQTSGWDCSLTVTDNAAYWTSNGSPLSCFSDRIACCHVDFRMTGSTFDWNPLLQLVKNHFFYFGEFSIRLTIFCCSSHSSGSVILFLRLFRAAAVFN